MGIRIHKEGRFFVALCNETGVTGHGGTEPSALANLEDALSIWRRSWTAIVGGPAEPARATREDVQWPGNEASIPLPIPRHLHNPLRSRTLQ